jgi:hypothetical protein
VLKKSLTYENPFTEQKITEDFWFHISKADLVKMEVEEHKETFTDKEGNELSGMQAKMQRIVEAEDGKALMPLFEDIIRRSYGRRDGDRFIRSEDIWADFKGSGAFDELLFELCTNAEASADFINGVMPGSLKTLAAEIQAEAEAIQKPAAKKRAAKKPAAGQESLKEPEEVMRTKRTLAIAQATVENPIELTQDEVVSMEPADLQTGLASGRFQFPGMGTS